MNWGSNRNNNKAEYHDRIRKVKNKKDIHIGISINVFNKNKREKYHYLLWKFFLLYIYWYIVGTHFL